MIDHLILNGAQVDGRQGARATSRRDRRCRRARLAEKVEVGCTFSAKPWLVTHRAMRTPMAASFPDPDTCQS
jgi:hypothetical protein